MTNTTYENMNTMTRGDRIRSMTNEELAWELMEFRFDAVCKERGGEAGLPDTQKAICEWLNQSVVYSSC